MLTDDQKIIVKAAQEGGKITRDYFGTDLKVHEKEKIFDIYTKADIDSEKKILEILKKRFPDYNYNAEESGVVDNGSPYTFFIDPLDGSHNYQLGVSQFATTIGLLNKDMMEFGVIDHPMLENTYYAARGKGAFLNGKKIQVNNVTDIERASVAYVPGYHSDRSIYSGLVKELYNKKVKRFADFWCPTLEESLLAAGKVECVIVFEPEIHDHAAGRILIREAGGLIVGFDGKQQGNDDLKQNFIAVNNRKILDVILPIVQKVFL